MAHPIVETKWQLDNMRALMQQLDEALDEADYRAAQTQEAIEQASKWEEAKENVESLAQQVMAIISPLPILEAQDAKDLEAIDDKLNDAYKLLEKLIEELNK